MDLTRYYYDEFAVGHIFTKTFQAHPFDHLWKTRFFSSPTSIIAPVQIFSSHNTQSLKCIQVVWFLMLKVTLILLTIATTLLLDTLEV